MSTYLYVTKGSDITYPAVWKNGAAALDLTGFTIAAYDVAPPEMASHLAVTITDAPQGKFTFSMAWDESFALGQLVEFRLRLDPGSQKRQTTSPIVIIVT